ncbi:unnamed protein product [Calypogeia fissa]
MGFTVAVKVEHLALPKILLSTPSEQSRTVLLPNMEPYRTVKGTVKDFIRQNLFIPDDLQVLQAPLFRKLSEKEGVEDIYKRYLCQAEVETPELHFDEDNFVFFAREGGRSVELDDNLRLEEYHILEKTVLQLRRLPQPLSETGGRIFVETKDGILPLLGVTHATRIVDLKHALERMTGIPVDQQLLSSVGRSMHNGLCIKDFDGPHRVCEDSTLDLCKSGDSNLDQAHCRMAISVDVMGEQSFTMVVQGRDLVQSVQQVVEARTGVATWQQRITYSGKILQEKKTLSDYFVHADSTLQVTIFRTPRSKLPQKMGSDVQHSRENLGMEAEHRPAARKIKMLRTSKGHIIGSITIPILTTDTVSDLKRKVRRTLQPLKERNFVILRSPAGSGNNDHNTSSRNSTPSKGASPSTSSKNDDQFSTSGRRLCRTLSGHLGGISNRFTPSKTPNHGNHGDDYASDSLSSLPPPAMLEGTGSKSVARALSFRNFAAAAPLFPPPLSSPNGSPPKTSGNSAITRAISEPKMTPIQKALFAEEMLPPSAVPLPSAGTPLRFVPMRPNNTTVPIPSELPLMSSSSNITASPVAPDSARRHRSHTRAASMGDLSFTPSQFQSLPVQPTTVEEEEDVVLPNTAPNLPAGSKTTTSPTPKKGNDTTPRANSEKRGLGAWFIDRMDTLKEHIKLPFAAAAER